MFRTAILVSCGVLLGTGGLAAQEGSWTQEGTPLHAEIGRLEAIGVHTDRIVISLPRSGEDERAYQSYDTDAETLVQGLGETLRVGGIGSRSIDQVVVLTYTNPDDHFLARRVYFTPEREIRLSAGRITDIDRGHRRLTLRADNGEEQRMSLGSGPGAVMDSDQGLVDLASLRVGQRIAVAFARLSGDTDGQAYLVRLE